MEDRDEDADGRVELAMEMLLPPDWSEPSVDKFSFSFSRAVFDGWVRQPSPCCAAASVAGATNAALGLAAVDREALSHEHILGIQHSLLADQAASKKAKVERMLGGVQLEPAICELRATLAAEGRSLGGRKEAGCKAKEALAKLRQLTEAHAVAPCARAGQAAPACAPAADGIVAIDVWSALRDAFPPGAAGDDGDDGDEEGGAEEALIVEPLKEAGHADGGLGVRKELRAMLGKLIGSEQLGAAQPKPSTAAVGNWGITGAVRALRDLRFREWPDARLRALQLAADAADEQQRPTNGPDASGERALACVVRAAPLLSASTLASVRVRGMATPPILLSKRDTDEEIEAAWVALRAAFARRSSALVLHHRNHYALIFATREWWQRGAEGEGGAPAQRVRQILTARKGQRPTAWIDWHEVHRTLAGWAGYAIIQVRYEAAA